MRSPRDPRLAGPATAAGPNRERTPMSDPNELRLPSLPDCWESCGACAADEVAVVEVLVAVGDRIERDQTVVVIETDKTVLDIPAERAGVVSEVCVAVGDPAVSGMPLLRLAAGEA